jgi:uncharacterized protein YcsI (UPF0317 family)
MSKDSSLLPNDIRQLCREGSFAGPTSGCAVGYVQANMVSLPAADAAEFAEYCKLNPKPRPVVEMLPPGNPEPLNSAPGADVRTDLPRYRVFRDGKPIAEPTDVRDLWRDDLVTFFAGMLVHRRRSSCRCGAAAAPY